MFSNKLIKYLAICLILAASLVAQIPNIVINEFLASNAHINYDPNLKNYSDWFELYNNENYQINLNGYYLTDDLTNPTKWQITDDLAIEADGYLVFWADNEDDGIHTNFQLNKDGEQIGIYTPDGSIVDTLTFNSQQTDISFGRNPNDNDEWLYYSNPTPGAINNALGYADLVTSSLPVFSVGSGFYENDISLEITSDPDAEIRYTLDGSEPDENSEKYTVPIDISDRTSEPNYFSEIPTNIHPFIRVPLWKPPIGIIRKATIVRAKVFASDKIPSTIVTQTYFIGSELKNSYDTIPVISLVSDKKHLFSDSSGIYVPGLSYLGIRGQGNYMYHWGRPTHIELFDENNNLQISQEVDMKIQGSNSRTSPQKGLHIIARDKYGKGTIDYPVFKNGQSKANKLTSFKRFMIRAWGTSWYYSMINDALAQTIYYKSSLDMQDYRPTVVFINGEYWGLQEIREANKNPYYFEAHYGIDKDDPGIDLLISKRYGQYEIDEGNDEHWLQMTEFIDENDLSITENYEYLKTQMDVDNFIDYIGHCVYFVKSDWPGQNEAFWRPRTIDGRWKWIQYDMDTSFGVRIWPGNFDYNRINDVFNGTDSRDPHPLLPDLIKNQEFKYKFINWFLDRINSDFKKEVVNAYYTDMLNELYPYLDEHQNRWSIPNTNFTTYRTFIRNIIWVMSDNVVSNLQTHFNLGELNTITINRQTERGTVKINTLLINENTAGVSENSSEWEGKYFEDVSINLIAIPNKGYVFDHWRGTFESQSDSISFYLEKNEWLSPVFFPSGDQLNAPILFHNYPNPFNDGTIIPFYLTDVTDVTIDIYNVNGNMVRSLLKKRQEIGYHEVSWDGRDDSGNALPSSVYLYRVQINDFTQVKKMLFLK